VSGIAGIAHSDRGPAVAAMLDRIRYRGPDGRAVQGTGSGVFGAVSLSLRPFDSAGPIIRKGRMIAWDGEIYDFDALRNAAGSKAETDLEAILDLYDLEGPEVLARLNGPFALALLDGDDLILARDTLGLAPLYYGTAGGRTCFASEIKALQEAAGEIRLFPPGHFMARGEIKPLPVRDVPLSMDTDPGRIAGDLRRRLEKAVDRRLAQSPRMGVWLSGGLDSSVMASLAAAASPSVATFSAGAQGASDLAFARDAASFLGTEHHECLVTVDEMLKVLPLVIYHLESFDAQLVRSSLANFVVARAAARYVRVVLSGEGADELFAGYGFLKKRPAGSLRTALLEAQGALHNTALQRVDRMAAACGIRARPGFLDADVVAFANAMPDSVKISGPEETEKWILRKAFEGRLPDDVVWRPKEKFWSGSGISGTIGEIAEGRISDDEFSGERELAPGFILASKEDLFYWRIFRRWFPRAGLLEGMGRTVHRETS